MKTKLRQNNLISFVKMQIYYDGSNTLRKLAFQLT